MVNVVLARSDGVTVGTDDDGPRLRLAVAAAATATLAAAVVVGYLNWSVPDRNLNNDTAEVVGIATSIVRGLGDVHSAEPHRVYRPGHIVDVAAKRGGVQEGILFCGKRFGEPEHHRLRPAPYLQASRRSARPPPASPWSCTAHRTRQANLADTAVLALRVQLSKQDGRWVVDDVSPIHSR